MHALNQYLYCPRRYWYYRFYDASDRSPALVEGSANHRDQHRQSGQYREQYYVAPDVGLHGAVDLVEFTDEHPVPVERKRGQSGQYYWNDEVQLAGYCQLLEAAGEFETIDTGYIYLYETDQRHRIQITDNHREAVSETIRAIQNLSPDAPPPVIDNPKKCRACSVRHECLPATTTRLSAENATNSEQTEVVTDE